jgi:hypothetical protein
MPKIRRQNLPPALFNHLLDRVAEREISGSQLGQFADWLVTEPQVPEGRWFKRFPEMIVCGEGALVKTRALPKLGNKLLVRNGRFLPALGYHGQIK